jgi:hypothetical protein
MDHDAIDSLARKVGVLPEAVTDIRSRVLARFAQEQPEPATVEQWLSTTLREAAPHLFPQTPTEPWAKLGIERVVWESLSPSTKLGLARQLQPQPTVTRPHPNRPVPREAPADVQAGWKDLPLAEKMTAYRAWRDNEG